MDDLSVEIHDRHQRLAGDLLDQRAVGVVDPNRLRVEALLPES